VQIGFDIARAEGLDAVTAAQWALNVAMEANPLGAIIAGVGVLVGLLATAFGFWGGMFGKNKKVEIAHTLNIEAGQNKLSSFSDGVSDAANSSSKFSDVMVAGSKKVAEQEANVKTTALSVSDLVNKKKSDLMAMGLDITKSIEMAKAKKAEDQAQFERDTAYIEKHGWAAYEKTQHQNSKTPKKGGIIGTTSTGESSKATGSKVLNINIKIDNVIKEFCIKTTNLKEGTQKAQDMVANALLSAINDSQIATDV
jgi:hypothetical protein